MKLNGAYCFILDLFNRSKYTIKDLYAKHIFLLET